MLITLLTLILTYLFFGIVISIIAGDASIGFSITFLIGIYFLPWFVALSRKQKQHPQQGSIFVLNLFLGWTFLGWVAALIWAVSAI